MEPEHKMSTDGQSGGRANHGRMRRLSQAHYQGRAFVLWNMTVEERATGWLSPEFHLRFRELQLHTLARHGLMCPMYCLMPDHMHLFWIGLSAQSDQHLAARFLRRHLNDLLASCGASLQKQAWDLVLQEREREQGAVSATMFYIAENPVRKHLVTNARQWPFSGVHVPGYPQLDWRSDGFLERLWRIHAQEVARQGERSGIGDNSGDAALSGGRNSDEFRSEGEDVPVRSGIGDNSGGGADGGRNSDEFRSEDGHAWSGIGNNSGE